MSASDSFRSGLSCFFSQAGSFTFDQCVSLSESQFRFDLGRSADKGSAHKRRRQRVSQNLNSMRKAAPNGWPKPLGHEEGVVASLPIRDEAASFGPVCSSSKTFDSTSAEVAQFIYKQWVINYDQARIRLELFSHPDSPLYGVNEYPGRSEEGVVVVQLSQLLCDLYASENPADRKAVKSFRRNPQVINWDDNTTTEVSEFYQPQAWCDRNGETTAICLPLAFYWNGPEAIAEFLNGFMRMFQDTQYELWVPGLCTMDHLGK